MINNKMVNKGVRVGKQVGGLLWQFAKSENALAAIKVAATFAAFVHSIEEWRKANRPVGFKTDTDWDRAKKQIGFKK